MDGCHLDLPDDAFDFVFSFSSIEHFGGHAAAAQSLREMRRVVRPGGIVAVATELLVNGVAHAEFFLPAELYADLIQPSGLRLLEDIDFSLSDETLHGLVQLDRPGWTSISPHLICSEGPWRWTSVLLFLEN